jgi:F420-dependent oxidoreductase-like protein
VELGIHVCDFTWAGGPTRLASTLTEIAQTAERIGLTRLSVMDHLWQIGGLGPPEHEMLEAYSTLGYLAASTSQIELHALVTAVSYREPGLLAKIISTLDVLSGGRAALGIGAAWNGEEAAGLGLFFPPTAERFERLEETLQICRQMWSDEDGPYHGKHYSLERTLDSPHPLHRPRIVIGGGGEKKTLRLVAKYGDGCNIFGGPQAAHKLDVLRAHCQTEGRDYDAIEKTTMIPFDVSDGGKVRALLQQLQDLRGLGFTVAHGIIAGPDPVDPMHVLGREVVPEVASW